MFAPKLGQLVPYNDSPKEHELGGHECGHEHVVIVGGERGGVRGGVRGGGAWIEGERRFAEQPASPTISAESVATSSGIHSDVLHSDVRDDDATPATSNAESSHAESMKPISVKPVTSKPVSKPVIVYFDRSAEDGYDGYGGFGSDSDSSSDSDCSDETTKAAKKKNKKKKENEKNKKKKKSRKHSKKGGLKTQGPPPVRDTKAWTRRCKKFFCVVTPLCVAGGIALVVYVTNI